MNRNGRCSMEIPDFSLVEHKSWTSLWPDDSRAIVQQSLDTATNGGSGHFTAFCPTFAGTPKWWDVIVTALYHDDGSLNYLLSVSRDITALRESNAALHESRERLHNIITQAATGVVETDSDGRITLANARFCAMLGRTEAGLLGLRVGDISAPEFVEPSRSAIEALRNGGPPVVIEKQYLRHDGSRLWATTSVNALRAADGAFEGMVAVIVDITDRKAAEEKLRDADQRKDEFLAMLAHELRNPLAPIGSAAQYLSSARLAPEMVQRTSAIIIRQVRHMTSLVDDLLDVSRVTRGLAELARQPVDLTLVVADAVEQLSPLLQTRVHQLSVQLPGEPALVLGDYKRLVQVVANLLNNAAKYTEPGGRIALCAAVHGDSVTLEISESGIGMDATLVERAFDLFAQAKRTPDRASGGLGLGLALVRSLVELHHGSVACSSAGPGLGSRFSVRLPRLRLPQGTAAPCGAPGAPASNRAQRVMIVDDNIDAGDMLALLMEARGHQVRVEREPHAALRRAAEEPADVFLLDIGLPGMSGIELAGQLRALPSASSAVMVAITGYGQSSDQHTAMQAGFDHYLVKPLNLEKLDAILSGSAVN